MATDKQAARLRAAKRIAFYSEMADRIEALWRECCIFDIEVMDSDRRTPVRRHLLEAWIDAVRRAGGKVHAAPVSIEEICVEYLQLASTLIESALKPNPEILAAIAASLPTPTLKDIGTASKSQEVDHGGSGVEGGQAP